MIRDFLAGKTIVIGDPVVVALCFIAFILLLIGIILTKGETGV